MQRMREKIQVQGHTRSQIVFDPILSFQYRRLEARI